MKKHIYSIFITLLIFANTATQAQSWQWSKKLGNNDFNYDESATILSDGSNFYLTGRFGDVLYTETDTLYSNGLNDMFVIKYDQSGNEIFAFGFGGFNDMSEFEYSTGVFDSVNQCIYLAGSFYGTMLLNTSPYIELTSSGLSDIFLAKMDLNGQILWAKTMGSGYEDNVVISLKDIDNKILLTGNVDTTAYFNPYTLNKGGYLAIYDALGNCEFAQNIMSEAVLYKTSSINNDFIIVGGFNTTTYNFDTVTLDLKGIYDSFILRCDSIGKLKWIIHAAGTGWDVAPSFLYKNNSIFYSGSFQDTLLINTDTLYSQNTDLFLVRIDENGNIIWKKQMNMSGNQFLYGTFVKDLNSSSFLFGGSFSGTANFGSLTITSNSAAKDMFIARFDTNGICSEFDHFGEGAGTDLIVNSDGSLVACGIFTGSVAIGSNSLTAVGDQDIFFAKHDAFTGIPINQRVRNELYIYANPSTGSFRIRLPDEVKTLSDAVLSVHDNVGKEVGRFIMGDKSDSSFDITNASSGLYIVRLTQGSKVYTGKLVVE